MTQQEEKQKAIQDQIAKDKEWKELLAVLKPVHAMEEKKRNELIRLFKAAVATVTVGSKDSGYDKAKIDSLESRVAELEKKVSVPA